MIENIENKKYFCSNPFEHLILNREKNYYLCCEGWLPKPIGNAGGESARIAWNGDVAREIRSSILDGSFRYCRVCPFLEAKAGPVQLVDEVTDKRLKKIIKNRTTVLDRGPVLLNLGHDPSCNLRCPSCRKRIIQTKTANYKEYEENKRIQEEILDELKDCLEWLYVSGSGDPFGSKLYHELLMGLKQENYSHLKLYLHTNGQLFDQKNWDTIQGIKRSVKRVQISIDAATENTYRMNRGSSWERLNKNLQFISKLRQDGPIEYFDISMVVQQNNWREMPEFIDLGRKYGADTVCFIALQNWGTYFYWEYNRRAVHLESHPEHKDLVEFLAGISHPHDIIVYWGPFARYVKDGLTSG